MRDWVRRGLVAVLAACALGAPSAAAQEGHEDDPLLSEEVIPLQQLPQRPKPLLELGEPFLGTGTLRRGLTLPTGAIWQPSLLAWGVLRTALHDLPSSGESAQWANRLDLFTQLSLTPTERLVVGLRPLDDDGEFSGYQFAPSGSGRGIDALNARVRTLYFEGDFGELFPKLDRSDRRALDYGFAVGRMPVTFQDGMLIDDAIDGVGLVRNTLRPPGTSNLRVTGIFGWGHLNRGVANRVDPAGRLLGLFTEVDAAKSQIALDLIYVDSDDSAGDGVFAGLSATQRIAEVYNTVFRAVTSIPRGDVAGTVRRGTLLSVELSLTPRRTHDLAYLNAFWALDDFTPAARAAGTGGPLGRAGILFEGAGVGAFAPVLSNAASDAVGAAAGYQRFFNSTRGQLVLEAGVRKHTRGGGLTAGAAGRFQHALGRRLIVRVDGFVADSDGGGARVGGRTELLVKF